MLKIICVALFVGVCSCSLKDMFVDSIDATKNAADTLVTSTREMWEDTTSAIKNTITHPIDSLADGISALGHGVADTIDVATGFIKNPAESTRRGMDHFADGIESSVGAVTGAINRAFTAPRNTKSTPAIVSNCN